MLLAFFQATRANQGGPQMGEQGVLMRYSRFGVRSRVEIDGVRFGGREEECRV